jgi:CMP-N-acetylneuraminic acid synthetase
MSLNKVLALIPARGGSKGIPRKNIREVGGKPLIAWSIQVGLAAECVGRVVVSTDDQEIAQVAQHYGSEIIERPEEISGDKTPMIEVIKHALDYVLHQGDQYEYLLLLQPTAPARSVSDVSFAFEIIKASGADSLISVCCDPDKHPGRAYHLRNERLIPYAEEPKGSLRQDLPPVYHRNGAIYLSRIDYIQRSDSIISSSPLPYFMPKERSINIDDEFDLLVADLVLKAKAADGGS